MNLSFNGVLELNDDNQYIVNKRNISEILEKNWQNMIPATYSLFTGRKEYKSEECILLKRPYKGLWDLYADDVNLENNLFNAVGKEINFEITYGKEKVS